MAEIVDLKSTIDSWIGPVDDISAADSKLLMDCLDVMRNFKRIPDEKSREEIKELVARMAEGCTAGQG